MRNLGRILLFGFILFNVVQPHGIFAQTPTLKPTSTPTPTSAPKKGIEMDPAFQEVVISKAEREKPLAITLINHESESIAFDLFPVTFNPKETTSLAQVKLDEADSYSYSLSSYILLPFRDIELQPGEKKEIPLLIQNRQDMPSGGTYVALIARQKRERTSDTTTVLPSISSVIFIHKTGGEIYNLRLKNVSFPNSLIHMRYPGSIKLEFQNEGNIHLIPRGRIEVKDILGRLVAKGVINTASAYVFPSSQRTIAIQLESIAANPPISLNTITVEGTDSLKKTTFVQSDTFLYIHPVLVVILVIIGLLITYSLISWRKRNIS